MTEPLNWKKIVEAFWAAIVFSAQHHGLAEAMHRVVGTVRLLTTSEKATPEVYLERVSACQKCPLFDQELETCGSAKHPEWWINPESGVRDVLGCLCVIRIKARLAEATCWLDDHSFSDLGPNWPK